MEAMSKKATIEVIQIPRMIFVERLKGDTFTARLVSLMDGLDAPRRGAGTWLADMASLSKPGAHKWLNSIDPGFCPHESSIANFIAAIADRYKTPVSDDELKRWLVKGTPFDTNKKRKSLKVDHTSIYIAHLLYICLGEKLTSMPDESISHILNAALNYHEQSDVNEEGLKILIQGMASTLDPKA